MSATSMQAVRQHKFGGPDVLVLERVARPEPLPTEVLIRVHAAGINPVDWKTRAGGGMAGVLGEPPFVLGWDVSGVVEQVGFGVTIWKPGDEVYGMPRFPRAAGGYAEYVTAPARQLARKPETLNHVQAAAVPLAGLTAWQSLVDTGGLVDGQRVLIHAAAGGVGHLAVQFAKYLGAHVVGTASAGRLGWLQNLGADEVIDYTRVRFEDVVGEVDLVVDLVGDAQERTSTRSLQVLRPGGMLISIPAGISPELAAAAEARGIRTSAFLVEPDGEGMSRLARIFDAGHAQAHVQTSYPLAQVAQAHADGETNRTQGKLVLDVTS